MAKYKVELSNTAFKALKKIPKNDVHKILDMMKGLAEKPFPYGSIKLEGEDNTYRIRSGDYRIIYELHNDILMILVLKIGHRKDVYR